MSEQTESPEGGVDEIALAREPIFQLGLLKVSPPTREVGPEGHAETVEPRVMQVLICLAHSAGQVVSRDDLIQRCWGGRIVGEDAINRCIAKVRRIADMTAEPAFEIETIPRVGYRLNRTTESSPAEVKSAPKAVTADRKPRRWVWLAAGVVLAAIIGLALPRLFTPAAPKPWSADDHRMSFAVLPLETGKDDAPAADYAAALTDELTAGLSSVPAIGTILPRSKVISVDMSGGPEAVGKRLQVAYLIEGTVRRQDDHFETSLSIVNVATGALLGTERLTEPVGLKLDPFREALTRTVSTLAGYGTNAEVARIQGLPESRRDARDLIILLEVSAVVNNSMEGANEIVALGEKAVALAPDEPHAIAATASALAYRMVNGWSAHEDEDMKRAESLAERVLVKDPRNLQALRAQFNVFLAQGRDEEGIAVVDRIIAVNPYGRAAYHNKAITLMHLGKGEEALATYLRMPHDADDAVAAEQQVLGEIYLTLGRYADAAQHLRNAMVGMSPDQYKDPNSAGILVELAAAEGLLGRIDRARQVLNDFRAANPDVATVSAVRRQTFYFMDIDKATTDLILASLRKAGLPE